MNKNFVYKLYNFLLVLFLDALLGTIIGVIIGLYQLGFHQVEHLSELLYKNKTPEFISLAIFISIILSIANFFLIKISNNIEGSGMPNLILGIKKHKHIDWKKGIIAMILNSYVSCFVSAPLGSEGPSIVIAGKIGKMSQDLLKKDDEDDLYLATGAGFGASYISPLAGVCYTFEEGMKKFKPKLLLRALIFTCMSSLMCYLLNHHQILALHSFIMPSINETYILLFLLIVNIPISCIFYKSMTFFKKWFLKHDNNFLIKYRAFIFFPILAISNFYFFLYTGSGVRIVEMNFSSYSVLAICGLLIFRILLTSIMSTGKMTGGIVIPIMAIGALTGEIVSLITHSYFYTDQSFYSLIILISMCMVLGIVNTCPITAAILVSTTIFNFAFNILHALIIFPFVLITFCFGNSLVKMFKSNDIYETFAEINLEYHLKEMEFETN